MIKDIIVNLAVDGKADVAGNFAISVAATFQAHVCGIAFSYEPVVPGSIFDGVSASIIASVRTESKNAAKTAAEKFEKSARDASLSAECRTITASPEGAGEIFGSVARRYDLSIVRQSDDEGHVDDLIVEAALFGSGRPVLVVPYIQKEGFRVDRVLLCWDGSRHAARAFADALPLIKGSKNVEVVTIAAKDDKKGEIAGADIAHHLSRHGLKVDLKRIVATDVDVAGTILSHVADTGADLIVMGGYGHSRLREFVWGGATRGVLEAMTVPTLLSH